MMVMVFVVFGVLLLIIFMMSIGVILQNKPITGSCGGIANALGEEAKPCAVCGRTTSCQS